MKKRGWVVLIQLSSTSLVSEGSKTRYKFPPLGLLYISSLLSLHGYKVHIIDLLSFGKNITYLLSRIAEIKRKYQNDPVLIGFTAYTENVDDVIIATREIKRIYSNSLVVVGGAHAKAAYEDILKEGTVDIVSLVEGEAHIIEILKYAEGLISIEEIRGIAYLDKDQPKVNERFFIKDLDLLPLPDFSNIRYSLYRQVGIIVTSRGCPGKCIFCASRQFSGSKYRAYSAERILAEMMFLYLYFKIKNFGIMDDTFTVLKERTRKFCTYLKKYGNNRFGYAIKSRVDLLNEETLSYLKETHCDAIHIGVESADNNVLKIMQKGTSLEKSLEVIEKIASYGITPECSFIIGNPGDTPKSIYKTLIMVFLLNKYFTLYPPAVVGICTPYPGTQLAINSERLGVNIIIKDYRRYDSTQPTFETKDFTLNFLRKVQWDFQRNPEDFIDRIRKEDSELGEFYNLLDGRIKAAEKYLKIRNKVKDTLNELSKISKT